ncbi:hypothetical protein GUJ93_ZPchr0013g37223 [Zizania palustris]|uniref:J domain-containing protein n=1 Tax=Zizania palustris TaxID=103762 RepID=A0A8J5WZC5_ZIZPA|nr:hypothetical protein GUJ93_ZPchr0013g37223 [Zizania palustris]
MVVPCGTVFEYLILTSGIHLLQNAFRTKAMEVHPDQNQDNREAAEEKFKEVVKSYEAINLERKDDAS